MTYKEVVEFTRQHMSPGEENLNVLQTSANWYIHWVILFPIVLVYNFLYDINEDDDEPSTFRQTVLFVLVAMFALPQIIMWIWLCFFVVSFI